MACTCHPQMAKKLLIFMEALSALQKRLASDGSLTLSIRVHPHAKKTALTDILEDGSLKISVRAAADDGEANKALVKFLSELFEVQSSQISILRGMSSRSKTIRINT